MNHKKLMILLLSFFLSCTAAYTIGQKIVVPLTQKEDADSVNEIDADSLRIGDIKYSFTDNFDQLTFEGRKTVGTDENPWGSTVAKIEDDDVGTSIMMVQGTGMSTDYHVNGNESVQWYYKIHPWVAEFSDGMSLYVRIYVNGEQTPRMRRSYIVTAEDIQKSVELPLNEFENQDIKIEFSTDNGGNGDSAGDWLVLSKMNIVSLDGNVPPQKTGNDEYWVSAHYFADASPMNLWDSEFENIDEDLRKIKSDGFNSIVLLVPWRQFQPGISKVNLYNQEALDKLDFILDRADEQELGVVLRIGYTWDYYQNRGNDEIIERYEKIVNDQQTREAWLEYVERVYSITSPHKSLWGGFICWEDFWNLTAKMKTISGKNEESLKYAEELGYSEFLMEHYDLPDIRTMYDDRKIYSEEDIYIPTEDQYAFRIFYDFYDEFLNELLSDTQTAFPNVSMEVRVDDDRVVDEDGENRWYSHENTYASNGSDYTSIMYGIPIGMINEGEEVTWEDALEKTENALEKVNKGSSGKKIYVDQFLYYDNTQAYSHNAKLIRDQIDDYLLNSKAVLKEYTRGYGIWVYKDYYLDTIGNGSFSDGLEGWMTEGQAEVKKVDGNSKCLLVDGAKITQNVSGKVTQTEGAMTCRFDADIIEDNFVVNVSLNGETRSVSIKEEGSYFVQFEGDEWGDLSISVEGEGFIDHVQVFNFCQNGLLYDIDGNEGELLDTLRELNSEMTSK